ncbi:hypothetical protein MAR_027881 [Mya arenaria]|uniref:Uncharacterized protein n=1 Tax=Mya arenaria TaxID=6604 RepID=A0ABY7DC01_MYAAR|nr:hypothetical protein MAR_027881 [Mya arenaria]
MLSGRVEYKLPAIKVTTKLTSGNIVANRFAISKQNNQKKPLQWIEIFRRLMCDITESSDENLQGPNNADHESEREHHETLLRRNEELKQKINNIRAERAEQEPLVAQDELNCRVLKLKEQEGHLALKIVQSPAKVMAEQEGLKQRVQEARDLLQRKQLRLTEIERQRKDIKQTVSNLEKGLALLELIQKSVDKESEVAADVSVLIEQVQEVTEQIHETECQKERVQELLRGRQERLSKLAIMHQNKVHILQQQIMADTEEKDNFEKKVANDSEKKSHLLQYRKRMEEDVHRYQKNIEQKVEALKNKYGQLLEKTDEYNTCIADEWNKVRQLLKK